MFNGIDFYCSANSVKTLTGLLNGFRHMLLNTERMKTFQFLDLIHQTTCALNFNKLLIWSASHTIHSCAWISDVAVLLILQQLLPPYASYVIVPCAGCGLFPTHVTDVRTSAASRGLSCLMYPLIEVRELHEQKLNRQSEWYKSHCIYEWRQDAQKRKCKRRVSCFLMTLREALSLNRFVGYFGSKWVTSPFPAGEFSGWSRITALWPKPPPPTPVQPDLSSSQSWILILDRLA